MAEVKKEEKKGLLGKLKEHAEDKEEQLAFLSTIVRLAVLTWSAGILTLNYVEIPGYVQEQRSRGRSVSEGNYAPGVL